MPSTDVAEASYRTPTHTSQALRMIISIILMSIKYLSIGLYSQNINKQIKLLRSRIEYPKGCMFVIFKYKLYLWYQSNRDDFEITHVNTFLCICNTETKYKSLVSMH